MKKLFALILFATALHTETLVLAGGRLIDGYGGKPLENAVIVIEGNTIKAVGPESQVAIPAGARVIDTNGYTVMPGLMDMHVHLMILGHGDYDPWDATYPSQLRDVIMPISASGVPPPRRARCSSMVACRCLRADSHDKQQLLHLLSDGPERLDGAVGLSDSA